MSIDNVLQNIDRRTFLRIVSFTGVAGLIYPRKLISSFIPPATSRLVIVEDETASVSTMLNADTVQVMIDSGIKNLAQQNNLSDAWQFLLPDIKPTSIIAIKVNCINSALSTHPEVTYAVTNSLKQMNIGGSSFPENNIIIFDRTNGELWDGGYTINTSASGVRCFGTNASGVGYSGQTYSVSGRNQRLSKIITEMADYLINISVLKNHGTAGVTLCLKNHYGTCSSPGNIHTNNCDPYIGALNALEPIKTKQYVNICDAIFGIKSGGPGGYPQFTTNKIIMSQDIVAVDYWGKKILQENGCSTTTYAKHINTAAKSYQLGSNNPSEMDVVTISNPTTGVNVGKKNITAVKDFLLQQNYPNPFNSQTRIRFYVSRPASVKLTVFNTYGRQVRVLVNRSLGSGWHQEIWDGLNEAGRYVSSGIYLCQLSAGGHKKTIIMQLVK